MDPEGNRLPRDAGYHQLHGRTCILSSAAGGVAGPAHLLVPDRRAHGLKVVETERIIIVEFI